MGKKSMVKMDGSKVNQILLGKSKTMEVEKVLEKRYKAGNPEPFYLIKWAGTPRSANKWIPKSQLKSCRWSINKFESELSGAETLAATQQGKKLVSKKISKRNDVLGQILAKLRSISSNKSLKTQGDESDDEKEMESVANRNADQIEDDNDDIEMEEENTIAVVEQSECGNMPTLKPAMDKIPEKIKNRKENMVEIAHDAQGAKERGKAKAKADKQVDIADVEPGHASISNDEFQNEQKGDDDEINEEMNGKTPGPGKKEETKTNGSTDYVLTLELIENTPHMIQLEANKIPIRMITVVPLNGGNFAYLIEWENKQQNGNGDKAKELGLIHANAFKIDYPEIVIAYYESIFKFRH